MPLADDQVLLLSGIQGGEHWYSVSVSAIQRRLEASPLVRRAIVERVFPDTILLTLWGRQPAALVLATSEGRSLPVLVDEDGVVFKVGTSSADLDLPVVSGLTVGDMALGARLPTPYRALFADLRALREKAPALCAAVSEVRVVGGGSADLSPQDLELLVYLTSSPVPIRARGSLDESLVKYALMATDLLSRQGVLKDIQELDFRGGDVVYKLAAQKSRRGRNPRGTAMRSPGRRGDRSVAAPTELIVGLDIGTTKVCAIIGEFNETGQLEIIGVGTTPSRGLRRGVVINIESTVKSIQNAVESAELMSGRRSARRIHRRGRRAHRGDQFARRRRRDGQGP